MTLSTSILSALLAATTSVEAAAWTKEQIQPAGDLKLGIITNLECDCGGYTTTKFAQAAIHHINNRDSHLCPAIAQIQNNFNVSVATMDQNCRRDGI